MEKAGVALDPETGRPIIGGEPEEKAVVKMSEDELKRLLVDVPLLVVPYAGDTLPWSRHINLAQWFRPLDRDEPLGG